MPSGSSPPLRGNRLRAAALRGVLLPPVPLVGHEGLVDGKVLHVGLQDVNHVGLTGDHNKLEKRGEAQGLRAKPVTDLGEVESYLLPLVDVKAVVFQFLLQNIRDADVHMDHLLLAFPLHVNFRLDPLNT